MVVKSLGTSVTGFCNVFAAAGHCQMEAYIFREKEKKRARYKGTWASSILLGKLGNGYRDGTKEGGSGGGDTDIEDLRRPSTAGFRVLLGHGD